MRLNLPLQRLARVAQRPRRSVSGGVLALSLALSSSCDDGIGHPIDAGAARAGASARSTTAAVGARASTTASGGSGAASTTASGGSGAASAISDSSAAVLVGGSASGGRSNLFTILEVGGAGGVRGGTRTAASECNPEEPWPEQWVTNEDLLASLIVMFRVMGVGCGLNAGDETRAVLDLDDPLLCFARQRSISRAQGEVPATVAGFESTVVVETQTDADTPTQKLAVDFWTRSDTTECNILMSEDFRTMEVGYVAVSGRAYWTIALR